MTNPTTRNVRVAAFQLGPIARAASRKEVVERLVDAMERAAKVGADVIAFPELALTTFFPRWYFEDPSELDAFFERRFPDDETRLLFDVGRRLSIAWTLGFAERVEALDVVHRFNTSVLVDRSGNVAIKYRKVHLPGTVEPVPDAPFQHLEKRYFEVGDLGFPVRELAIGRASGLFGLMICNDRRWPEAYRLMGLQGVEMIFLGYNTPMHNPEAPSHDALTSFHNHLVMQSGAYQNSTWVVGVAKGGCEEGVEQLAETAIIAPSGEIVAQARGCDDELVLADCDLEMTRSYSTTIFDLASNRRPKLYGDLSMTPIVKRDSQSGEH